MYFLHDIEASFWAFPPNSLKREEITLWSISSSGLVSLKVLKIPFGSVLALFSDLSTFSAFPPLVWVFEIGLSSVLQKISKNVEFFRDACKIKIAHILSHWDNWKLPPPPPPPFVSKTPKNERFLPWETTKNRSFSGLFETIRILPPSPPPLLSKRQNMSDFF